MQICIAWFASEIASLFHPLCVSAPFWGSDCSYSNWVFDLGNPPPAFFIQSTQTHTHTYEHAQHMITFFFICRQQSFVQFTPTSYPAANHAKQVKHEKLNTFPILWPFQNNLDVLQPVWAPFPLCPQYQPASNIQHASVAGFIWCMLFLFGMKTSCFIGIPSHRQEYSTICVFHPLHPPKYISLPLFPSLSLFLTHTEHVCWCRKMFAQHISIWTS